MANRSRRSNHELKNSVGDSERIIRGRNLNPSRTTGREVSPLEHEAVMTRLLEKAAGELDRQVNTDTDLERVNVGTGRKTSTVRRSDVRDMIDHTLNDMDFRIQDKVEKTVVDFLKTVDVDYNKSFTKNVLKRAI